VETCGRSTASRSCPSGGCGWLGGGGHWWVTGSNWGSTGGPGRSAGGSRAAANGVHDCIIGALLVDVVIPEQRGIIVGEGTVDPALPVGDTPNADADASRDVQASLGNGFVVSCLLCELARVDRFGDTNIKLGDSNLEAGCSEPFECALEVVEVARDQVRLGSNTVNWCSTTLKTADEGDLEGKAVIRIPANKNSLTNHCFELGSGVVKVVVVHVELGTGVDGSRSAEGNVNKLFTEDTVEDAVTPSAVVFEDFVTDILAEMSLRPRVRKRVEHTQWYTLPL
jgi:hypothetical protein